MHTGNEQSIEVVDHRGGIVHLLQLTDTHLCQQRGGTLLDMDTDHSLQAVVDRVKERGRAVDLVLGTGDMSDGGYREAYQRLDGYFGQLSNNHFYLPGNHDSRQNMEDILGVFPGLCREIQVANWQILMLDSQIPGQVGGRLGERQLQQLAADLQRAADQRLFSLICMHHHPVHIGSAWLDQQMVSDADRFFAITDQFDGVAGVLWGHVHQQVEQQRNNVRLMASPSTCVQFAPGCERFKADDLAPGYRWLDLHPDGSIDTRVDRVEGVTFTVDLDSGGYL